MAAHVLLQMYLDIGTPGSVYEALNERIAEHLGTFAGEFTGQFSAMNISSGDPMKIQLGVFFEFSHNGARPPQLRSCFSLWAEDCRVWHGIRSSIMSKAVSRLQLRPSCSDPML